MRISTVLLLAIASVSWSGCTPVTDWYAGSRAYAKAADEDAAHGDPSASQQAAAFELPSTEDTVVDSATAARDALKKGILFLPFRDLSKYEGPWHIYTELPRALGDSLAPYDFFRVVPIERVLPLLSPEELKGDITKGRLILLGRELGADVVINGEIEELSMKRFRATVPLGGYRNYQGVVNVNLLVHNVIDGRAVGEYRGDITLDSKRTGIVNPAVHVPLDREYYFLGEHPWGTEEFMATLVGQSVGKCLQDMAKGLSELVTPPPALIVSEPKLIDIEGTRGYINVGLAEGIRNGDKFGVWDQGRELRDPDTDKVLGYASPRRVGVVQVEQVLGEHLSQVLIIDGEGRIRKSFLVRAE
jgi:hypothetical protein